MFSHLERFRGDPILGINTLFQRDSRPKTVNLSIGIYLDEEGRVPLLRTVQIAERRMLDEALGKPYLPIEGTEAMLRATAGLLFGQSSGALQEGRVATVQTVGSSGALKIAGELIKRWFPGSQAWVSSPSWENHRSILEGSGVTVNTYPYYDARTGGLDATGMLQALDMLPAKSVVVLHGCCHNPTGVDLDAAQWQAVVELLQRRGLLALVDLAYQGYGAGLEQDAVPVRAMADAGVPFFLANSFSKNFSIYGERAGALSIVTQAREDTELAFGQMQAAIRRNWSNPPMHANGIVSTVLNDPQLRSEWLVEVEQMRQRILRMRRLLHDALSNLNPRRSFAYLLAQRGMFSYSGLSAAQVGRLRDEHGVYLVESGRICVAALRAKDVDYVAQAMTAVL